MSHFSDIELQRWRDSGPGDERERVIAHLAACRGCASRYAAAIRARPLDAEPAADAREFASAGRAVAGRFSHRRRWLLSAAAAAALIVLIALPVGLHRHDAIPELHLRGSGIVALAPEGAVDRGDIEFAWSSAVAANRYRIDIGRANAVVYTAETAGSRLSLPSAARDSLQSGVEYWWNATALDASGKAVATTPRRTFIIR